MTALLLAVMMVLALTACGSANVSSNNSTDNNMQAQSSQTNDQEAASDVETAEPVSGNMEQTGYTIPVPADYTKASDKPGTVIRLDYDSKDYVRDESPITKTAYVYTPYGYDACDPETRYNILYLMHGWGGHAGEYFEFANLKNMFDNLIEKGEIPPLIIVSATFYNANSNTDFSSSIAEFRQFHRDFEENLMPARFHRAAGGRQWPERKRVFHLSRSRDERYGKEPIHRYGG